MQRLAILAVLFVVVVSTPLPQASERINGIFAAAQDCAAFQSKRKRTNPGDIHLQAGQTYPARELDRPGTPGWVRIEIPGLETSPLRWVPLPCGELTLTATPPVVSQTPACSISNQYDSYVLAISWQPAFCEGHPGKTECELLDQGDTAATAFTLHGLWPDKHGCGTHYGFCGAFRKPRELFCDYPALPLSAATQAALRQVMPSYAAGTCLQRHEWYKHGTCQERDPDEYFQVAIRLLAQVNQSALQRFIAAHIDQEVRSADVFAVFDASFGMKSHRHIKLSCREELLTEIHIRLPKALSPEVNLADVLAGPTTYRDNRGNCGDVLRIDGAPAS